MLVRALRVLTMALLLGTVSSTAYAQMPRFDALYVFGDSLADNGNDFLATSASGLNPPAPPSQSPHRTYFEGRFSNGYVAVEYLWQALSGQAPGSAGGLTPYLTQPLAPLGRAVDFAFGGTGTPLLDQTPGGFFAPGLKGQLGLYLAAPRARQKPKRPLYVISTGANDYRVDQYNAPMSIEAVVENIVATVKALYRDGARDIMVVNLPDLGLVPAHAGDGGASTELSLAHNDALRKALDQLASETPKLQLIQANLIDAFNQLPGTMNKSIPALELLFANDPTLPEGFHMSACLFIDPATCKDSPVPFNIELNSLFWDVVHPTTEAHWYLGQFLLSTLEAHYSR